MALTIWGAVKSSAVAILRDGTAVSVAVVQSGSTLSLKWKRERQNGTWPGDGDAVPISTLSAAAAFDILETNQGVEIGNPAVGFWLTRNSNPLTQSQFVALSVEVIS